MKITAIETLRLAEYPNLCWVLVHTDEGIVGLGETFFGAAAVSAYIHETTAPLLLGQDPRQIDRLRRVLSPYVGYAGTGVEMRGNSAIDIALWDIVGQMTGQPLYQLLGGLTREAIWVYNTCAGSRYIRARPIQRSDNWGLTPEPVGPYEDLDAFLHRADDLARSLLEQGITGMKIWPFDPAAEASFGQHISARDLDQALEPFRKIRAAVGDRMEIMVELHGLWSLPMAKRIAQALEPFAPFWLEDPIRPDDLGALAELARATRIPLTLSETLATRWGFRELLERRIPGVVMLDVSWCGGLSEARRIAAMAEAYQLPVAPHDCTGPVVFTASVHLAVSVPNALTQEVVRAFHWGWYRELVTELPPLEQGQVRPLQHPGLGTRLRPELFDRPDAIRQYTAL